MELNEIRIVYLENGSFSSLSEEIFTAKNKTTGSKEQNK